jgi:hypothetical protein
MIEKTKEQHQKSEQVQAAQEEAGKQKQKAAEQEEVVGKHKNDGKNDHAGHKTSR